MVTLYKAPETFTSAQVRHFEAPVGMVNIVNDSSSSNEIVLKIRKFDFEHKNTANNISYDNRELFTKLPWINQFIEESLEMKEKKKLLFYFEKVDELAVNKEYNLCNRFLYSTDVENLSNHLLVGFLRLTYSYKDKLPYWDTFFNKSRLELVKRNVDTNVELQGL